ncbi:MAG: hypothetical protein H6937_03420 [Burkholderiales bacterium]|nr:hypothetical protein [Burkholderiales bacterium]MDR4518544.1 hypothetical protein [Nitrosomonas sp.]
MMQLWFLPGTWLARLSSSGISSGVITLGLWKPLKHLQGGKTPGKDQSSDLIGLEFVLTQDIDLQTPGKTPYSGEAKRIFRKKLIKTFKSETLRKITEDAIFLKRLCYLR